MPVDGREATLKVRDYFVEVHGPYAVIGFSVENVSWNEAKKEWEVQCSFFPGMVPTRDYYEVTISEDGGILNVAKIAPQAVDRS